MKRPAIKAPRRRLLMLLLAALFALSAAMTGTAAWADLSQHRTNVAAGSGRQKPADALLQKYELGTQTPVPGAHFTLYKMNPDGTAAAVKTYITGPDGQALASELEPGAYYWQETQAPTGFLPEVENGLVKKYPFSVPAEDGEPIVVIAYNARQKAGLTVTKTVDNGQWTMDNDAAFEFTAVIGGVTHTFTLKHGESKTFGDIPVGTAYTVTESPAENYTTTSENSVGQVPPQGITAAFTNTYEGQYGYLVITKAVTGQGADPEKEFTFTAEIGGQTQSFTLRHGQSKVFPGLPAGTQYSVTEADYSGEGYTTAQRSRGGTVANQVISLVYVNVYGAPEETGKFRKLEQKVLNEARLEAAHKTEYYMSHYRIEG